MLDKVVAAEGMKRGNMAWCGRIIYPVADNSSHRRLYTIIRPCLVTVKEKIFSLTIHLCKLLKKFAGLSDCRVFFCLSGSNLGQCIVERGVFF